MLTEEQLRFYGENGYVVLDSVFPPSQLEECSAEYDQLFERKKQADLEATWQGDWNDSSPSKSTSVRIVGSCIVSDFRHLFFADFNWNFNIRTDSLSVGAFKNVRQNSVDLQTGFE